MTYPPTSTNFLDPASYAEFGDSRGECAVCVGDTGQTQSLAVLQYSCSVTNRAQARGCTSSKRVAALSITEGRSDLGALSMRLVEESRAAIIHPHFHIADGTSDACSPRTMHHVHTALRCRS